LYPLGKDARLAIVFHKQYQGQRNLCSRQEWRRRLRRSPGGARSEPETIAASEISQAQDRSGPRENLLRPDKTESPAQAKRAGRVGAY